MDIASEYLLASRHDTLKCGRGEPGMYDSMVNVVTNSSKSPQKRNAKTTGLKDMMNSVVDYCKKGGGGATQNNNDMINDKDIIDEDLSTSDIFELINQHMLHLALLKENDLFSYEESS